MTPETPETNAASTADMEPDPNARAQHAAASSPTKASEINLLIDLISFAYAAEGRAFSVPISVAKTVSAQEPDLPALRELVSSLTLSDPLLAVPKRLLSAVDRSRFAPKIDRIVVELAAIPLCQHAALEGVHLSSLLWDEEIPGEDILTSTLDSLDKATTESLAALKPTEKRHLRNNVILALALILAIQRRWPISDTADFLDAHLWRSELAAAKLPSERAALIDGAAPVLGLVSQVWRDRVTEALRAVEASSVETAAALESRDAAQTELAEALTAKEDLLEVVGRREADIAELERALDHEREQRRIEYSHAADDYENLRTRVIRGLSQHVSLLEDGLHALRNGSSKVTEEYAERVIDAIRQDLGSLRTDDSEEIGR